MAARGRDLPSLSGDGLPRSVCRQPWHWAALLVLLPVSSAARLHWASSPALPNQTVAVQGQDLGGNGSSLDLWLCVGTADPQPSNTSRCQTVDPLAVAGDGSSLKLLLPAALPMDTYSLLWPNNAPAGGWHTLPINSATVFFAVGSGGWPLQVAPGGTLRVVGHSLAFGGPRGCASYLGLPTPSASAEVQLLLSAALPSTALPELRLTAAWASCHAALFSIPPDLPQGTYTARFLSDLPSAEPTSLLPSSNASSGTPPTGPSLLAVQQDNWTPSLQLQVDSADGLRAALAQAQRTAGGAVIGFRPNTQIVLTSTLVLPNNTVVQGLGSGVQFVWSPRAGLPLMPVVGLNGTWPGAPWRVGLSQLGFSVAGPTSATVNWMAPTVASFVTQVSITLQPSATGGPVGPCFQVSGGTGLRLESNTCVHGGNCSALSWPHNTAFYASLLTGATVVNNSFLCYCQGYSFDSSSFLYIVGNRWESLGNDSEGSHGAHVLWQQHGHWQPTGDQTLGVVHL